MKWNATLQVWDWRHTTTVLISVPWPAWHFLCPSYEVNVTDLKLSHNLLSICFVLRSSCCRLHVKWDGAQWRTGEGEVKGKLANGVGSQCSSHYVGTWCIQQHTSAASSRLNWRPRADLNGLVRFAERRNLVSARVPSRFNWPLLIIFDHVSIVSNLPEATSFLEGRYSLLSTVTMNDTDPQPHPAMKSTVPPIIGNIFYSFGKWNVNVYFCNSFGYPIRGMFLCRMRLENERLACHVVTTDGTCYA